MSKKGAPTLSTIFKLPLCMMSRMMLPAFREIDTDDDKMRMTSGMLVCMVSWWRCGEVHKDAESDDRARRP